MAEVTRSGADKTTKAESVLVSNMLAAIGIADTVRTSLGPRGMDKMITGGNKETTITNDGATMLAELQVAHPCAKMLVEVSHAQDVEAGDGTTTVVVIAGSLLQAAQRLVTKGFHPNQVSKSFGIANDKIEPILIKMATPVSLDDKEILIKNCETSLSSKMVKDDGRHLAEISVDAVLSILDSKEDNNADLKRVKIINQVGSPVSDCKLIVGLALARKVSHYPQAKTSITEADGGAHICLVQFCLSPPKTDLDCSVVVGSVADMDRTIKKEREYILNMCRKIKDAGINVLLIQKSILRDAIDSWALNFLAKMKIMVVQDIERDEVEFICRSLGCLPAASLDQVKPDKLGHCEKVEEVSTSHSATYVRFTGIKKRETGTSSSSDSSSSGSTVTILCCGPNKLMLEEAERSLHDSLCVARSLVKKKYLITGGGAAEVEIAVQLGKLAREIGGLDGEGIRAYAEAMEIIPLTLAENAGINAISALTELRKRHAEGKVLDGIHTLEFEGILDQVKETKGDSSILGIINAPEQAPIAFATDSQSSSASAGGARGRRKAVEVVQPLLVTLSAITLATETVRQILRIDDIVGTR